MRTDTRVSIYGNTSLVRAVCRRCDGTAIVLDGALVCCGAEHQEPPTYVERVSDAERRRKQPSERHKRRIPALQENRCRYCDREFGTYYHRGGKAYRVHLAWDHVQPWVYGFNNHDENFVAACWLCNAIKASRMFESLDEIREHVALGWYRKGAA